MDNERAERKTLVKVRMLGTLALVIILGFGYLSFQEGGGQNAEPAGVETVGVSLAQSAPEGPHKSEQDPDFPKVAKEMRKSKPIPVKQVSLDDPTQGPKSAQLTIYVYSAFDCPACRDAARVREQLSKVYPKKIRWVWRDLSAASRPLSFGAARLARLAQLERGNEGFWAVHDHLLARPFLGDSVLTAATALGLKYIDARERRFDEVILAGEEHARKSGVISTPTWVINDQVFSDFSSLSRIKERIFRKVVQ